jgi:hypothetical protein
MQCIYSFRGARPKTIQRLLNTEGTFSDFKFQILNLRILFGLVK